MLLEVNSLVAIVGMAAATYATRATGLWLVGRGETHPFLTACLRHAPGAILVALLAPIIMAGGLSTVIGALVTVVASLRTGNLAIAMLLGVGAAALMEVIR